MRQRRAGLSSTRRGSQYLVEFSVRSSGREHAKGLLLDDFACSCLFSAQTLATQNGIETLQVINNPPVTSS